MFRGKFTSELFEKCLEVGLCKDHFSDFVGTDGLFSYELQRKAFLFCRLQILGPILFKKPFSTDKLQKLFAKSEDFSRRDSPEPDEEFMDNVLLLDAVVVFTLCHFCKVCCSGALFKSSHKHLPGSPNKNFIAELLTKNLLDESDIRYLNPLLQENFTGYNEDILKFCYVATLLFVRNVTMNIKLKQALKQQEAELQSISKESEKWAEIGAEAFKSQSFEESVKAYSSAVTFSPYSLPVLKNRANAYFKLERYKDAELDNYVVLMIHPTYSTAYLGLAASLHSQKQYLRCKNAAVYGLKKCMHKKDKVYEGLLKIYNSAGVMCHQAAETKARVGSEMENTPKEDIPELIEASDSEGESVGVPDLMEASNSEQSDSESESPDTSESTSQGNNACLSANQKSPSPETFQAPSQNSKKSESARPTDLIDALQKSESGKSNEPPNEKRKLQLDSDERKKQVQSILRAASQSLLNGCSPVAAQQFRDALDEIKNYPLIYKYDEHNIMCIEYALGMVHYRLGEYEDLKKALAIFKGITETYDSLPVGFYGSGLVYMKLNWFKQASEFLKKVKSLLNQVQEKERDCDPYCWPGLTTIIEETSPDILKLRVEELLKECENPPLPDATCRFENCSLHAEIYLTDPDFKGFFSVQCSEQCGLQYHPLCWKTMKNKNQLTDKDFLEQKCLTPDCEGILIKVQCTGKDGAVNKEFSVPDPKKGTKLKKTKLVKKLEVKEEKKRRRKDSSSKTDSQSESNVECLSEIPMESESHSLVEIESKSIPNTEDKENVEAADIPNVPTVPAKTEPFIVLKKEKLADENASKSTKVKEHKKAKNTISIDEFLQSSEGAGQIGNNNVYQQRLNTLRQNNQTIVDGRWKTNISSGVVVPLPIIPTPNYIPDTYFSPPPSYYKNDTEPEEIHEEVEESTPSPLESASAISTEPAVNMEECIKENVYSYLKGILGQRGPLKVDEPFLVNELKQFPAEANIMIADCGGIGEFLQKNVDFAFVGNLYVCLVDHLPAAYNKIINTPMPDRNPIDLFDSYEDTKEDEDSQLYKYSYLNPDAEEYQPSKKIPRNSPQLISAVSRLRRPLAVDCAQGQDVKSNESSVTDLTQNQENCDSESPVSNDSSTCSSFTSEKSPDSVKTELVRLCTNAVKVYHSAQADECRPYIDSCLKPYAIVELPKRISKNIQTENEKMVSKGTMKSDAELERVKEVVTSLSDENYSLVNKIKILEEQYQSSQDSLAQLQNKSSTEQSYMKLQHEDAKSTYEREKIRLKGKESELEKKNKQLTDQLNKAKEENSVRKSEVKDLMSRSNNLKTNSELLEAKNKLLEEREASLKDLIKSEMNQMNDLVKKLQSDIEKSLKRAKDAELLLLHLKKTECLQRIDTKTAEASQRMKEIQEGMTLVSANLNPLFTKNLDALVSQIQNYITKLGTKRIDFMVRIDDQINEINNGTPLQDLRPLEMKALPEIPSWTSQLQMPDLSQNNQASWTSQIQMMNSALNSMQLPQPQFAYPPMNNLQIKNNPMVAPPPIPQAPPRMIPPPASTSVKPPEPENESSKTVKKFPPGLQDPLQPLVTSSTTSINSQPVMKPQVSDVKPKQPKPKARSPISMSRESLLSNVSDAFKKSTASYDALELGYKPGKAAAPNVTPVASNATASAKPTGAEPKNSFQKLLTKLQTQFPSYTNKQLMDLVKEVRDKKNGLSGLAIDNIISEVSAIIEAKMQAETAAENFAKYRLTQSKVLVNKNIASKPATPVKENTASKKCPWKPSSDSTSKPWTGNEIEEECIICCEDMPKTTAYKVDCGHFFHFKCIKEWLSNKSDCPICRVHLLLPEDYPALA